MNERIKLLAEQAGMGPWGVGNDDNVSEIVEKFAELIVEECFKAAMIESKGHMNPIDLIKRMKERVGVEE